MHDSAKPVYIGTLIVHRFYIQKKTSKNYLLQGQPSDSLGLKIRRQTETFPML